MRIVQRNLPNTLLLGFVFATFCTEHVHSQELKNDLTDKTCGAKDDAKYRIHSLMIVKNIHSKHGAISTFNECAHLCFNAGSGTCPYFGYHSRSKSCLFFKRNLKNETISRLLVEKWRYGRIITNKRTKEYIPSNNCTESFCEDTCLPAVEEVCSGEWGGVNCDLYTGMVSSCEEVLRKTYTLITGETINATHGPTFKYNLLLPGETAPVKLTCPLPEGVLTRIETESTYNMCLEPKSGDCTGIPEPVVYRYKTTNCQDTASYFIFNPDKGTLWHACSKKQVCFKRVAYDFILRIKEDGFCNENPRYNRKEQLLIRTFKNGLQLDHKVLRPSGGGNPRDGTTILLGRDNENKQHARTYKEFHFTSMPRGPVMTMVWETKLGAGSSQPPAHIGYMDQLAGMIYIDDQYSVLQKAIFVAPQTGAYRFFTCSDDEITIYISSDSNPANKRTILSTLNFCSPPDIRYSDAEINLQANEKYYVEVHFIEDNGNDYFYVGMDLPDGTTIGTITTKYLEPYEP
ncbi:uncharacterized protein [Clytia hemisphaerica]|uniref:PA14 domain-containing protein n=1 Tax=Clytia hemisphaerica TaxID=252671 RepID=A0A7M5WR88_9CNID